MTIVVNGVLEADTRDLNELSQLALVASDTSYKGSFAEINEPLRPFDDTPQYGNPQPPFGFEFQLVSTNYVVHERFEDAADLTGFKAVAYRNTATNDIILAFAGTDGPDVKDWWGNIFHTGWNQWEVNIDRIQQYVDQFVGANGQLSAKIHFVGQSLGGALAQFASYDFVSRHGGGSAFDKKQLSLVTFNALGGVAALSEKMPGFNPNLLSGLGHGVHYVVENDLVHRLGNGHVGGQIKKFAWTDANATPGSAFNRLDPVDAHRIESAFYRYLNPAKNFFKEATNAVPEYLAVPTLQKLVSAFGNLERKTQVRSSEAVFQFIAGLIPASLQTPEAEVNGLIRTLLTAYRDAGKISPLKAEVLFDTNWSRLFRAAAANSPTATASTYAGSLALGTIGAAFEQSLDTVRGDVQAEFGSFSPPNMGERSFDTWEAQARVLIGHTTTETPLAREFIDKEELAKRMNSGQSWFTDVMSYVIGAAANAGLTGVVLGTFGVQAIKQAGIAVLEVAQKLGASVAEYQRQISGFVSEFAQAIANTSSDYLIQATSALSLPVQGFYVEAKAVADGFLSSITQTDLVSLFISDAQASQELVDSEALARRALQTVVIRSGRSANPFDDASFDPDALPLSVGQLKEGSVQTFTAYLPYEAGEGGQRIKLELAGAAAEKLSVLADGGDVELGADGTLTLTVAEGQRELSFNIAALEDVDVDETFTLSAQLVALVDGNEVATHLEHEELELALDAREEGAPAGGMELHGDWGLKLYPKTTSDGTPVLDENGNPVLEPRVDLRYPHRINLEREPNGRIDFGEQLGFLTGLDGADHIWLGEFGGAGGAVGGGGDDYFEGMVNVPNLIIGDYQSNFLGLSGNDTIEGGENARPYSDPGFTREGEHIEGIGDDILFGGLGDDDIYADRIALLTQTLDPNTPALDQKGDWITGEQGDDRIFGSAAHDALFGGGGADEIHGGAGNDVLDGDDNYYNWGDAWWEVDPGFFGVTFFPVTNVRRQSDQFSTPFEYYKDVGGDDVLDGGAGDDLILGMLGDDTLIGGAGKDRLEGWEGNDQLFGGAGDDVLAGDFGRYEVPWFRMPGANLRVMPGAVGLFSGDASVVDQVGNDFLDGGSGNDQLFGEAGDDTLLGRDGADVLFGDAGYLPEDLHGDDLLDGGAGADTISGNGGDDRIFGGPDNDSISGDAGNDQADGGPGDDSLSGGEGNDILNGGDGADVLAGDAGADVLHGGDGDDQLAGGEDDDILHGDAGADSLDGGAGADSLYGGSGEDLLSGGEGNDLLDGGAGIDVLRGGAGDDTYVFAFGYGQDLIEDSEGSNRLRFGAGIAPDDLSAALDGGTLSATIVFGGAGDSATLNMSAFQVGGVDFAGGTTWGRMQFLSFMPALVSAGSESGEVLVGNENLRNELRGLGGDDNLIGSANDDLLDGGAGADSLDGGGGSDVYVFTAADSGIDALADSELQGRAYLDWYYGNLGIPDWTERGQYGGKYRAVVAGEGEGFTRYYDSFEQAFADFSFAEISFVEPLPSIAPLVRRDDQAALDELVAAGVLSRDVAEFAPGLALSDLTLSVTVNAAAVAEHPEQPWYSGGTLSVRWGSSGFDLEVPGVNYGFAGSDLLTDGSEPQSDAPGAWRGYRLGEGIEAFRFADGSTYSLEEILEQAAVVEVIADYAFSRGSGTQLISRNYGSIVFDPDIRSDEVSVSRDGTDLLITVSGGGAQGRIAGWYDDPDFMPSVSLKFSSDPELDAATLTEMGLRVVGTDGDDVIAGLDGFGDVLSGASGSDILDGGAGQDTYVFNRGDGVDTITEVPSGAGDPEASIVVFGPDIFIWQVQFGLGSLVVDYGEGDAIHFAGFNADDPYATPVFERLEFDDGGVIFYDELLADIQFQHYGTEGDDVLTGTGVGDIIDGGEGNDALFGRDGEDNLEGGAGDDTLAGGAGDQDSMSGGEGSDTYVYAAGDGYDYVFDWSEMPGEIDRVLLTGGITPADVRVTRDEWSYHLVLGGRDRLVLDSTAVEPAAEIERIEFEDGTVWTAADLAARVELVPGTELDDALWGTPGNDVLEGFAGNDLLYGHGGDDVLIGGEDSDYYFFAAGDGADRIDNFDSNPDSWDSIRFADAASSEVSLAKSGSDLVLHLGNGGDRVTLIGWYADEHRKIDSISFDADGGYWDAAMLEQLAPTGGNSAPELSNPLASQTTDEDSAFTFTVPGDTFSDADAGDTLTYGASLADGSALPAWLSFDPATRSFFGMPVNDDVGAFDVTVTATDTSGERSSDSFRIEVLNTNDPPVTQDDGADVAEDAVLFASGNVLANDIDVDEATVLTVANPGTFVGTYGILALDADGSFGYTLDNASAAVQQLRGGQVVTDTFAYAASDGIVSVPAILAVSITGANDAPATSDDAAAVQEDGVVSASGNVLANDSDVDGGTTLVVAGPGTYSGIYGTLLLHEDGIYAYALDNDSPAVQALRDGETASDALAYEASDGIAQTPGTLAVTVTGANDAPLVLDDAAAVQEDGVVNVTGNVLANDTDVDYGTTLSVGDPGTQAGTYGTLTLGADGSYGYALDNAAAQSLRGGATVPDVFGYAASDSIAETPGWLTITVTGANDAPVAHHDALTIGEDDATAGGNVLANDTDVDAGTMLTVTNPGICAGSYGTLTLGADGSYAYALDNAAVQSLAAGQSVSDTFGYVVADDDAMPLAASGRLLVAIAGVNDAPILVAALSDQSGREGEPFSFTLPSGTFADVDAGDRLTLSAALADGSALPNWLSFENESFSGTPGLADGGDYSVHVTATDTAGASAAASFTLAVSDSLANGNRLVGTSHDDALNGTGAAELLDGRGGADRLLAGGGDDVLQFFADYRVKGKNRSRDFFDGGAGFDTLLGTDGHDAIFLDEGDASPRLAGIEYIATGEGHDLVDLRSGRFAYGDVVLDGGEGNDVLRAASGNDLLLGGKGNDELSGGAGQDIYIHGLRGGNDEIDEAGVAGEADVLRFGEGIRRDMVRARRHHDDLVLDVAGPHGSVTVKGWFASDAQRIELIEFADGNAWDERIVRRLVRHRHDDDWHDEKHWPDDRHDERRNRAPQERGDRRDERAEDRDEGAAAISERLWQKSCFDFETLARELDRSGKQDEALSPQEIARRWAAVHRYTSALALEADEHADHAALTGWQSFAVLGLLSASGFGFEASIGAARGPEGLKSLEGLSEGFRRL